MYIYRCYRVFGLHLVSVCENFVYSKFQHCFSAKCGSKENVDINILENRNSQNIQIIQYLSFAMLRL